MRNNVTDIYELGKLYHLIKKKKKSMFQKFANRRYLNLFPMYIVANSNLHLKF